MSSKTEIVIDFSEPHSLSIPCPKCQTRVRMECNGLHPEQG